MHKTLTAMNTQRLVRETPRAWAAVQPATARGEVGCSDLLGNGSRIPLQSSGSHHGGFGTQLQITHTGTIAVLLGGYLSISALSLPLAYVKHTFEQRKEEGQWSWFREGWSEVHSKQSSFYLILWVNLASAVSEVSLLSFEAQDLCDSEMQISDPLFHLYPIVLGLCRLVFQNTCSNPFKLGSFFFLSPFVFYLRLAQLFYFFSCSFISIYYHFFTLGHIDVPFLWHLLLKK